MTSTDRRLAELVSDYGYRRRFDIVQRMNVFGLDELYVSLPENAVLKGLEALWFKERRERR